MKKLDRLEKCILIITLIYISFNGWFMFPICKELFDFSHEDILAFLINYGIIGISLSYISEKQRPCVVFILVLFFTVIGMVLGYYWQIGGISNSINYTRENIGLYITIVPMYCTIVHCIKLKY